MLSRNGISSNTLNSFRDTTGGKTDQDEQGSWHVIQSGEYETMRTRRSGFAFENTISRKWATGEINI